MIQQQLYIDKMSSNRLNSSILSMKHQVTHEINEIAHNLASVGLITKHHILFQRYSDRADRKESEHTKIVFQSVLDRCKSKENERLRSFVIVWLLDPPALGPSVPTSIIGVYLVDLKPREGVIIITSQNVTDNDSSSTPGPGVIISTSQNVTNNDSSSTSGAGVIISTSHNVTNND